MPRYVDGFLLPVPKKNLKAYVSMSKRASRVFRKYGMLQYCESIGDDLKSPMGLPFTRVCKVKRGETVVFSWIVYKSRAHRDRANKMIMKDPQLAAMMEGKAMPFDMKRMAYGGFKLAVDL